MSLSPVQSPPSRTAPTTPVPKTCTSSLSSVTKVDSIECQQPPLVIWSWALSRKVSRNSGKKSCQVSSSDSQNRFIERMVPPFTSKITLASSLTTKVRLRDLPLLVLSRRNAPICGQGSLVTLVLYIKLQILNF